MEEVWRKYGARRLPVWRKYDNLTFFQHHRVADEPAAPCERLPVRAACSTSREKNEKRRMSLGSQP